MQDNMDFPLFRETFMNLRTALPTSLTLGYPWKITDTSAAGTPTFTFVSPSATGEARLTLASNNEVENVCLDFGDVLPFGIANVKWIEFNIKCSALTAGTTLAFGLQSARNDNTDSTAVNAQFKLVSDNVVLCETDDGTTDTDDKPAGVSLSTVYKKMRIDFGAGLDDVQFYVDGVRVAASQRFNMSAATGSVQPFVQLQKTATTAVDNVTIDDIAVSLRSEA
jgi:hypothetical protein